MNRSFVLRQGRFTDAQKKAYETLAESFLIPFERKEIEFEKTFGNSNSVTLEIGFGMGIATAVIAGANPDKNYLCVEVHRPGIGRLLWEIEKRGLSNIRIIEHDAVEVMEMIRGESLAAIHIFFPDPWPKKRHHKRRLVQRPFTQILAGKLAPPNTAPREQVLEGRAGGYLYMVTDWEDYGNFALAELGATTGLINAWEGFAPPASWRPVTEFEKKGKAKNLTAKELFFYKK
jgi:tRNA (guanine-N7-)-methyltransferase